MSTESKIRLNKYIPRPVLTYAAESWAETSNTKSMLRSVQMRRLQSIRGVTLRGQTRSSKVSEDLNFHVARFARPSRRYSRNHVEMIK